LHPDFLKPLVKANGDTSQFKRFKEMVDQGDLFVIVSANKDSTQKLQLTPKAPCLGSWSCHVNGLSDKIPTSQIQMPSWLIDSLFEEEEEESVEVTLPLAPQTIIAAKAIDLIFECSSLKSRRCFPTGQEVVQILHRSYRFLYQAQRVTLQVGASTFSFTVQIKGEAHCCVLQESTKVELVNFYGKGRSSIEYSQRFEPGQLQADKSHQTRESPVLNGQNLQGLNETRANLTSGFSKSRPQTTRNTKLKLKIPELLSPARKYLFTPNSTQNRGTPSPERLYEANWKEPLPVPITHRPQTGCQLTERPQTSRGITAR
jgi:hypothetical protein